MVRIGHKREKMIKFIGLGFLIILFISLIYEVGYVHGYEDAEDKSQDKRERDEEKTN